MGLQHPAAGGPRLARLPGIQAADEPTEDILKGKNKLKGTELLGLFSGIHRTEQQHNQVRMAPDLIFVFRGPILRCSKGDLRAEVKTVVWHEVAHWLGYDEKQVKKPGPMRRRGLFSATNVQ